MMFILLFMEILEKSMCVPTVFGNNLELSKVNHTNATLKIVSRKEWNANEDVLISELDGPAQYVVIHDTYLPPSCDNKEECTIAMQQMQFDDLNNMGYPDILYNFAIGGIYEPAIYEGRGWGLRSPFSPSVNTTSVSIGFIGDYSQKYPPFHHINLLKKLIKEGVRLGYITTNYKLIAHIQNAGESSCPGAFLYNLMRNWENFVAL